MIYSILELEVVPWYFVHMITTRNQTLNEKEATMPKVTFEMIPVVCVTIKGEIVDGDVRKDGGLVRRFLRFQLDGGVYTQIPGGFSGAGAYCGFFSAENAKRIEKWLLEQGADAERDK
jgi:hypothetical protein